MRQLDWAWVSSNKIKSNGVMVEIMIFRGHKLNQMIEDRVIINLLGS